MRTPLDQEGQERRVRGADQLLWASLERGDTTPKAAGQGPTQRGYRPQPSDSPVDIFRKMKLTDLDNHVSFNGGTGRDADGRER